MIRKLSANDHEAVMKLIGKKPAENLFLIGDIEVYGYESDIQEIWGQFEEEKLIAILLRYNQNYIPYSEHDYDVKGFAEIISQNPNQMDISGLKHIIEPLEKWVNRDKIEHKETYYAKCNTLDVEVDEESVQKVTYLHPSEYQENIDMLNSIPEFANSNLKMEDKERAEKDKTGRTYVIRDEAGMMVASASTTAENTQSAMVVGVGTRPGFERQGYATKCLTKLCAEVFAEGKSLCLFYDNPAAGNIYKRLGFTDIGFWTLIRYEAKR